MSKQNISSRINEIMLSAGDNYTSFSNRLGLNNNVTIRRIIKEDRNPSFEVLLKIVEVFPEINCKWLITGQGLMKGSESNLEDPLELLNAMIELNDKLMEFDSFKNYIKANSKLLEVESERQLQVEEIKKLRKVAFKKHYK